MLETTNTQFNKGLANFLKVNFRKGIVNQSVVVGENSVTDDLSAGDAFAQLTSDETNHSRLILKEAILMYEGFRMYDYCFFNVNLSV